MMARWISVHVAGVAVVLALATASAPLRAQEDDEARACFERGVALYESGRFEPAAVEFERAYELRPSFKILYNLALAETELGHHAAAFAAYTRYLEQGGMALGPERIAQVQHELVRLESLTAYLVVEGGSPGSLLLIDNEEQARLPLDGPLLVDLGRRTVVVEKDGKRQFERVVRLAGQETLRLMVPASSLVNPSEPAPAPLSRRRLSPWPMSVAAGLAVLSAGALVGFDFATRAAYDDAKVHPEQASHQRDFELYQSVEWVMLGATAACGITAVVLAFFTRFEGKSAAVGLSPLDGGAAVGVAGSF